MTNKEEVRPIYAELQGYLFQAPKTNKINGIYDSNLWEHANQAIEELSKVSGKDYSRFKMTPKRRQSGRLCIDTDTYRAKIGGLISRLHAEYFSDEPDPFSETPSTVMSQIQQHSQSFQVELLLQVQSKIDEQLHKLEPGDKKRSFLEKVKGALKSVRNTAELIALILATGQEFGLTLEELKELFK